VNRQITGAIVRRQPFGGWRSSAVGPTAKVGGPSYLLALCRWADAGGPGHDFERTWSEHFAVDHDPSGLVAERNVLRHRPLRRVVVRFGPDTTERETTLVRDAARITGVALAESSAADVDDDTFASSLSADRCDRLRIVGGASAAVYAAGHRAGFVVDDSPPVAHGRVELLRWVREQTVTETMHRYGNRRA
jgi:RHH-type transcriptional regulator, proline utilization regulon repressor / proline dehydrogenase / delta 1-pyrroline-5-carboxylate dehydrogenase